jgi:hypothetical protein
VTFLLALGHCFVDFVLSVRYMFRIEKKVGQLLLQFVVVDPDDIASLQGVIEHFLAEVLHLRAHHLPPSKLPLETIEESALELIRGTPNTSAFIDDNEPDSVMECRRQPRRKSSQFEGGGSEKLSLSQVKIDFKERRGRQGRRGTVPLDRIEAREESIVHFREQYGSCGFILRANLKRLLMLLLALLLSGAFLVTVFFLLYMPAAQYPDRVEVL